MLFSRHNVDIALLSSWQLWLPSGNLHKMGEGGPQDPPLRVYRSLWMLGRSFCSTVVTPRSPMHLSATLMKLSFIHLVYFIPLFLGLQISWTMKLFYVWLYLWYSLPWLASNHSIKYAKWRSKWGSELFFLWTWRCSTSLSALLTLDIVNGSAPFFWDSTFPHSYHFQMSIFPSFPLHPLL